MTDTYASHLNRRRNPPANQPVMGREAEMTTLTSGAVVFKEDKFNQLRKALILGTASNTFYNSKWELTEEFEHCVIDCARKDGSRTADIILEVSDKGLAVKVDSCLFALVVLSVYAPSHFYRIATKVVRTLSHLHSFVSYVKAYRGTGGVISKFGKQWFAEKDAKYLTYQYLKFNQRQGFTLRDQLRIFKPSHQGDEGKNRLFAYVSGKADRYGNIANLIDGHPSLDQLGWVEWLKSDPTPQNTMKAVNEGKLTHEMVAPLGGMNDAVWSELFKTMPIHAIIRNLSNLASHRVFEDEKNLILLAKRLGSSEGLRKARVHPYQLLVAARIYGSGGQSHFLAERKSKKTWLVNDYVKNILDRALEISFECQEPTNQRYFFAIDISGSMGSFFGPDYYVTCSEVAALMALVQARIETSSLTYGFDTKLRDLNITASDNFSIACQKVRSRSFGGTNAGSVYKYAIEKDLKIDTFCFYTDGENYGGIQSFKLLDSYREKVNPYARAVYVTLSPRNGTLADPQDPGSLSIGGFDPQAPRLIQEFSLGNL